MQLAVDLEFPDLSTLLEPRSIVVIGASDRPGNLGGDTVRRLLKFGFPGQVWAVNRSKERVAGVDAFATVGDLPEVPDLAIFAIPAASLYDSISECIEKGIRAGVAYAGGFGEAGEEGLKAQQVLAALCRESGFVLCGPNCVGIINTSLPVTSTFATALHEMTALRKGSISMVSQSGGIGTTAFSIAEAAGFGFRHLVSSGNEAVVTFSDYLHAFSRDEGTEIILGYLEGVIDGKKFIRALEEARRNGKVVIMIKAGASGAGARAAKAHTGALVGEDRAFDAIFRETGVIRAYSVDEAVEIALLIAGDPHRRMPSGRGVGIVTFGGGNGVLAVDQCAQNGLATPELSEDCVKRLKPLLVSVASAANPMDLTPTTAFRPESLALLPKALDVIAAETYIDAIVVIVGTLASKAAEISEIVVDFCKRSPKPVCLAWPAPPEGLLERLAEKGVYAFVDQARGIRALSFLAQQGAPRVGSSIAAPADKAFDWQQWTGGQELPAVIGEDRCHAILRAAGLSVAAGHLATSEDAAVASAQALGFPVVMKGISPAVTHRAAAGLLAIGVDSEEAVRRAYCQLTGRAAQIGAALDGILVQKMEKGGVELLVSSYRDPVFGVMIACGTGGGLTELVQDVVTHRAPVDRETAAVMIESLRIRSHAKDTEGLLPVEPAAAFVAEFSQLTASAPFDRFVFEVNPIKWTRQGAIAIDGLLILE